MACQEVQFYKVYMQSHWPVERVAVHDTCDGYGGPSQEVILGPVVEIKHLQDTREILAKAS